MSNITPFTFITSINEGRKGRHLLKDCKADQSLETANPDSIEKHYVSFVINRSFSYKEVLDKLKEFSSNALIVEEMKESK